MTTTLRGLFLVFGGAVLPAAAAGGVVISCGGDDNGRPAVVEDGGSDSATGDAGGPDGTTKQDSGGPDSNVPDVTNPPDGNPPDSAPDVAADVLAAMYAFPGQVAAAICDRNAVCCGFSGLDASSFNAAKCLATALPSGFKNSSLGSDVLDGGNVTFDLSRGQACLGQIAAADCVTNQLTSAVDTALYADCFGAFVGTLPVDASCRESIECAPGEFCDPVDGGGASGVHLFCQPLRTVGQSCGDFYANPDAGITPTVTQIANAQTACSDHGSGDTNLACAYLDPVSFGYIYPPTCVTAGPLDSGCASDQACTSRTCAFPTCVQAEKLVNAATCTAYTIPDAGGGG